MKKVLECYNEESEDYDKRRFASEIGHYIDKIEKNLILRDTVGKDILELCCGTGRFAELFSSMDIKYTGIDFSDKMLKQAKKKKVLGSRFICMNVNDISRLKDKYDTIFSVRAVKFWDNPKKTFKDCYNLLNRRGRLIIHFIHKNPFTKFMFGSNPLRYFKKRFNIFKLWTRGTGIEKNYSNKEITDMMEASGFKVIKQEYYFNPLFGLYNFAKFSKSISKFFIWTDKKFRWGWRSIIIGRKDK